MNVSGEVQFSVVQAFAHGLDDSLIALERAVVISLFTDAPAGDDDVIPDEGTDRRGYWADTILPPANAPAQLIWITGSKLWLIWREKQTQITANRAKRYAETALEWLVAGAYARSVDVDAYWLATGVLVLPVKIILADGTLWQKEFTRSMG